ncbi:serine proteinase inhibitor IA-1 [Lactarius pseudohatsudake]|nr:serine proteinase inhibitor IA-1 [Lactarius pseudohatsudake]
MFECMLKYIVVFKKSASDEVINEQAKQVGLNGGTVTEKFSSSLLKGFSAEIPDTYFLTLQRGLTAANSQIDYIEPHPDVVTHAIPISDEL